VEPRPTMQSVAERADVSRQTVSNVLNAPHLVRDETRERVRAAIEELDYRPHRAARQLRTRRSHIVGLRVQPSIDGIDGAVMDRFLHAITEHAQGLGYRIMLFTAPDDRGEIAQYRELLDTVEVDAFVLTDTHRADPRTRWLAERDVPFVTFGRPWDRPDLRSSGSEHAWVDVDGAAGTSAAVDHLRSLGHHRIGFIGWPPGSGVGDDRRRGWQEAMRSFGLRGPELDVLSVGVLDSVANGARAATDLLERGAPTAFVCASDALALGAMTATRAGLAPTDPTACAVVGSDDTAVAQAVGLSSVAQPLHEAAAWVLRLLLSQLPDARADEQDADPTSDRQVLLCPDLVVRASSVAPVTNGADP
jgi:DNA-binding LacI/PurR family transcriptional regulator